MNADFAGDAYADEVEAERLVLEVEIADAIDALAADYASATGRTVLAVDVDVSGGSATVSVEDA